jgi:glutamine synthetase
MITKEAVLAAVEAEQIRFIDLWFTDIMGIVKSVTVPGSDIDHVIENGVSFDGSSLEGFARVAESDMVLMPDLSTFAILPWDQPEERTARLICTVHTPQGEPFLGDPRAVLIQTLQQAEAMGYSYQTGMEMEFFLFRLDEANRPVIQGAHDEASYYDMSTPAARLIRRKMLAALADLGIDVDSAHSEIGYGQHEIDFHHAGALASADQVVTARVALKTVAQLNDLYCTFMPRPSADMPGSGMHTHQSLHDRETGANLFRDPDDEYGLSEIARYFLAGQLHHARAMCAVLAPLVNSYKRLGTSFEAPVYVTWAHINRAALIRVPSVRPGESAHTRIELRCPDPSSNPYLAMAVMLQAGLDGIQRRMTRVDPLEETLLVQDRSRLRHLEVLPVSLGEALDVLQANETMMSVLGPYISDRYLAAKRQELDDYNQYVTTWEVERYISRY